MKEEIKRCLDFVNTTKSLPINEFEHLLKERNADAKEKFIMGYMHYIFSITYKVYMLHENLFNAYYDFEELFNDAILIAIDIYNKGKYAIDNNIKYRNFVNFTNDFRRQVLTLAKNTYFMKVGDLTFKKITKVISAYEHFIMENGHIPSIDELEKLSGCSKRMIKNVKVCDNIENYQFLNTSFEKKIIDKMVEKDFHNDLVLSLSYLSEIQKEVVCRLNGFDSEGNHFEPELMSDLAREKKVTHEAIRDASNNAYKKIRMNNPHLKNYRG